MVDHIPPATAEDIESSRPRKRAKTEKDSCDVIMSPTVATALLAPDTTAEPPTQSLSSPAPLVSTVMASAQQDHKNGVHPQASKEIACGITEFVCPELLGFTGILKKRYTDFLVNEILPSGQVVHLDNTQAPKKQKKEVENGSRPSGLSHHKPGGHQEIAQKGDVSFLNEAKVASMDAKNEADNVSPRLSSPTVKPEEEVGPEAATNAAKRSRPSSVSNIPASMQGFDASPTKPENLAPHKRIAPTPTPVPLSMRDMDDTEETHKPARKKETVRIRRTSQGWMEVDEQKEKEIRGAEVANDGAVNKSTEKSAIRAGDADETTELGDSAIQEVPKDDPEILVETRDPLPPTTQASWQAFADTTSADVEVATGFKLNSEDMTALLSYFGPEVANELLALHGRILDSPHRKAKDYGTVKSAVIDRQTRSKIHQDLRRMFNSRLETVTDNDGHMIITALPEKSTFYGRSSADSDLHQKDRNSHRRNDRGRNGRGGNNNRDSTPRQSRQSQWAELGGDFLHFSLYKENKDTMEAISWLVRQLNMKPSAFQFAGTKDRRGVTVQRVSVYRVFADRMVQVGRTLRGAKIGNFEYQPHGLQLGDLKGNEFIITLRECDFHYPYPADPETLAEAAEAVVGDAIKHLGENGFINYYGLQRFGTFSTSTDRVGVKILRGDFEGAVEGILHFEPATLADAENPMTDPVDKISREDQARAYAINLFKTTGKSFSALQDLPRKFSTESSIIRHLGKQDCGKDYFGAIQTVSRNMRLMFVHAYQSLVWNMAASHRWKRFGATVIEGDLVLIDEHQDKLEPEVEAENIDADGEVIVHPSEDDRAVDPEDKFTRARALTKEEAESGKYTIFDVVLPTPGYDILYPANGMTKFYEEFMGSERGGGLDPHDMRRKWKDASLSGSYRKLLARPSKDFSFDIKVYKSEDEQFVETDLDRLEKVKAERVNAQHSRSAPICDAPAMGEVKPEKPDGINNGAIDSEHAPKPRDSPSDHEPGGVSLSGGPYSDYKIAVILKLQLGSSQYATMALRELMKHGGARAYKADFSGGH